MHLLPRLNQARSRWLATLLGLVCALLLMAALAPETHARGGLRAPAPANVTVVRGDETLSVTWDEVQWPGTTIGYWVFTSTDGAYTWQLAASHVLGTSTTLQGMDNQQAYHIGVMKPFVHPNGNPYASEMGVSAPVPAVQAPGQVGTIGLTRGAGFLTVTWLPPAKDSGIAPKGYDIVYSDNSGGSWHRAGTEVLPSPDTNGVYSYRIGNGSSVIDDTLGYLVGLRAVNAVGAGPWRNGGPVAALNPPPGAPTSVTVQRGSDHLDASWPAVAGATSYNVVYSSNNGGSWTRAATEIEATSYRIPNIPNTGSYIVAVQAVNNAGSGPWRNSASIGPL